MEVRCMARATDRYENTSDERIFDTSVCHARFRPVRVDPHRARNFNERRKLDFDPNRKIAARMKGVVFRKGFAVGFRPVIIDNIEHVMDGKDWPDMGGAKVPDTYAKEEIRGWEGRWGKDRTFNEKWNIPRKKGAPKSGIEAVELVKGAARKEIAKRYAEYEPKVKPKFERIERYYNEAPDEVKAKVREYKDGAVEAVTAPTASSKKKAYALNEYALTLMEMKKYDLALNYFDKAVTLDPLEETYRTNKARCIDWMNYNEKQGGK
jgi:hypothetical protein